MAKAMNSEYPYLKRIIPMVAVCILMLIIISGSGSEHGLPGAINVSQFASGESGNQDDNFRMIVTRDDPQPNGDHWSIYVKIEEKQGELWDKTDRNITAQVIIFRDSQEQILINVTKTDGTSFFLIHLSYELEEGNYTVRAKALDVEMDWMKEIITIPLTSRPPYANARILVDGTYSKEATIILDREHQASIILDSALSWDPDEGESALINYTWTIGETMVTLSNTTLHWTFTEPGYYVIKLKAEDPSEWNMYSEDSVTVHVQEITYLPDLRVSILADTDELVIGEKVQLTVSIDNVGNNDTWGFDINFYDRNGIFSFQRIGLVPYGMNRLIFMEYSPIALGQERIQVLVDPGDEIEEWNEDNNEASVDITVLPEPLPDMIIETLATNGSYEVDGMTFISIILKNNGSISAYNVKTYLYINSELMVEEIFESVGAGDRTTVVYTWIPKVKGVYTAHIVVWVNSTIQDNQYINDMVIVESNPGNPRESDDIPMMYVALSGGILVFFLAAIGFAGIENTKYKILGSVVMTPLYTRLKKEDTLNHEVRARVYEHIVSHPGDSYASILHTLDLKNGTLVHHLRTLERERYVKSKKDGKFKRFYPWGTKVGERDPKYLTDIQMEIVDIIKSKPGVSQASIANILQRSRQSINYQIKILNDANLINVMKHGISTRCYMHDT